MTNTALHMRHIRKCARMTYCIAFFAYILTDFWIGLVFLMIGACSVVILDKLDRLQDLKSKTNIYVILFFGAIIVKYAYSRSIIL